MHFVHPPRLAVVLCLFFVFFSFASLLFVLSLTALKSENKIKIRIIKKKKKLTRAKHLMQFSWHQEPLKDSSGL